MPSGHPAEFLRALLDAAPFGVMSEDQSGVIRLWSRGAQAILGWSEDELIGRMPPGEIGLPADPNPGAEVGLFKNDGKLIEVRIWRMPWQEGKVSIFADNSEPRRAERAMQDMADREKTALARVRAERRYHDLLEAAPDAIIEVDSDGRILTMNARTEQLFGYDRNELRGRTVDALVPDHVRARHASHRAGYAANPLTRPMGSGLSLEGRRKDGSTFPVEISLSPLKSDEGYRVTAVIRDITERKQIEERLQAIQTQYTRELELRNQEVEVANRHKSEFLANMSHELRTPLHTVIGFSELLAEESQGPLNDSQKRFIGHIHKDAQHLLALINDILDLSKIEAGKVQLRRDAVDIAVILDDALASIQPRGIEKSVAIETNIESPVIVEGDRIRLKQILYNLLSNAVKFTPANGRVQVEMGTAEGYARISVRDTGVGIPLEEQESVFEKFHQVGGVAGGAREGTGLGLPISRRLVEEHGGRIWLESEPGLGSCFTFTIPLKAANEKTTDS
jgi:PAS domain S-box-containing protein